MYRLALFVNFGVLALWSCSTKSVVYEPPSVTQWQFVASTEYDSRCGDAENYIPDTTHLDFWPEKEIRINFHIIDRLSDRRAMDSTKAWDYQQIVTYANDRIKSAPRPRLPIENPPARLPWRWRYLAKGNKSAWDHGVYFHYDEEVPWHVHQGKKNNRGNYKAYDKYKYRNDSILNVFLLSHHPDSLKSPSYKGGLAGVAFGNKYIKLAGDWKNFKPWEHHTNLIHEVGHIYSLGHSWLRDGCDDTPRHKNCWNVNEPPDCTEISNNVMDYSAAASTLTPCQIGKVHAKMAKQKSLTRAYLTPNWCKGKEGRDVNLSDTLILKHEVDLEGNLTLHPGAYLEIRCRLNIPEHKKIRVAPGATLHLAGGKIHNDCGYMWAGIEVGKAGKTTGQLLIQEGSVIENTLMAVPQQPLKF